MFKKDRTDFYEGGYYGLDLRPKIKLDNVTCESIEIPEYLGTPSPEMAIKLAEIEKRKDYLRETSLNEKPEFFENLERVHVESILDTPDGWNLFDEPTDAEVMDLMRSIESVGLIFPIHVLLNDAGVYSVIIGRFRLKAYRNLFKITKSDKYMRIPAYVIKESDVDELFLRNMIFESNFKFRTISKFNLIQTLIANYEIMRKTKANRRGKNVAMELAKQFEVSESTVFDYLKVKKLCDSGLYYLYEGKINLKAAVYLARVSKDLQEDIIKHFGVESVNAIFRLKLLTAKDNVSLDELKKRINQVNDLTPEKTRITIEVHRALLNALIDLLIMFKKREAAEYAGKTTVGKFNNVFKIKCNMEDMGYYLEKGIVNKASINKLLASNIKEMANIR